MCEGANGGGGVGSACPPGLLDPVGQRFPERRRSPGSRPGPRPHSSQQRAVTHSSVNAEHLVD